MAKATGSRGDSSKPEVSDHRYANAASLHSVRSVGAREHARSLRPECFRGAAPAEASASSQRRNSTFGRDGFNERFSSFLTETDSQTEIDVTPTKQTIGEFLTGTRIGPSRLTTIREISRSREKFLAASPIPNREHMELEHAATN
jgi:hypothetical protein